MRYSVFSITHRELLFVCYCDETPCEAFDIVTFLTKRFCKENELRIQQKRVFHQISKTDTAQ